MKMFGVKIVLFLMRDPTFSSEEENGAILVFPFGVQDDGLW